MMWKHLLIGSMVGLLFYSCSAIDEDLDNCGQDYQLVYNLRLVTNMTTELETVLSEDADVPVANALRNYLRGIFTDYAHDVDLSFYDVTGDSALSHHEGHIMDANQTSYTIYLPVKQYMHVALANIADAVNVNYRNPGRSSQSMLWQQRSDTIRPHTTGLFTARLQMNILDNMDQTFFVHLYMANSAAAIVVDTTDCHVRNIRAVATNLSDGFYLRDSVYTFNSNPIITTDALPIATGHQACFATVCFPSTNATGGAYPSARNSSSVEQGRWPEGTEGSEAATTFEAKGQTPTHRGTVNAYLATNALWQMRVYAEKEDGTVTENIVNVYEQLKAGNLKILKLRMHPDGSVESTAAEVGVSVTLNWKPGGQYDPDI